MKPKILKFLIILTVFSIAAVCYAKDDPLTAAMYNELGVKAVNDGQIDAAISYFEQAHSFDPSNTTVKKNLSVAYSRQAEIEYTKRNITDAEQYLNAALEYDPDNINALYLMGELKYLSQNMDEARSLWEKLLQLDPNYKYANVLKEKLAKLDREAKVEEEYATTSSDPFEIRYAREGATLSYDVRYYLGEAYRLLGQEFDLRPQYKISVLIYDKKDFEALGGWRKGTEGGYDGKIRLPFIGANLSSDEIRGIVWHEYTHLLVHDVSKGRAPVWLNEGLAQYEGYEYIKKDLTVLKYAVNRQELIPLADLDSNLTMTTEAAKYALACQEAYTAANYLMKRYNRYKVREVLQLFGEGETFESIAKDKLGVTLKEFERRWLDELKEGKLY